MSDQRDRTRLFKQYLLHFDCQKWHLTKWRAKIRNKLNKYKDHNT